MQERKNIDKIHINIENNKHIKMGNDMAYIEPRVCLSMMHIYLLHVYNVH